MKINRRVLKVPLVLILAFFFYHVSLSQKVNETYINLADTINEEIIIYIENYLMDSLDYSLREDSFRILTDTLIIETQMYSKKLLWFIPIKEVDTTIFMNHIFFYDLDEHPKRIHIQSFAYIGSIRSDTLLANYNHQLKNRAKTHSKELRKELEKYLSEKKW